MYDLDNLVPKTIQDNHVLAVYNVGASVRNDNTLPKKLYMVIYEHTLDRFLSGDNKSNLITDNSICYSLQYVLDGIEKANLQFLELPYLVSESINSDFSTFLRHLSEQDFSNCSPPIPEIGYEFYMYQLSQFKKEGRIYTRRETKEFDTIIPEVAFISPNYVLRREVIDLRKKIWNLYKK